MPISNPGYTSPSIVTATVTNKITNSVSTTAAVIIPANENRRGLTILNSHTSIVYFDIGGDPTVTDYMFLLSPGNFYEMPLEIPFTGAIHALTSAGSGSLQIREFIA